MTIPQMSLVRLAQKHPFNVGAVERAVSGAAGWKLVRSGLRRRTFPGLLLAAAGALLLKRGATGRCPVYARMGVVRHPNRAGGILRAPVRVGASIVVHRPRQEVYAFWRDVDRLGAALGENVDARAESSHVSTWSVLGRRGQKRWTARITEDAPGEVLAWQTIEPSDLQHEGAVRFFDWSGGGETLVVLEAVWDAPAAALAGGARLYARHALRRVKSVLEAGEAPVANPVSARRAGGGRRRASGLPLAGRTRSGGQPSPGAVAPSQPLRALPSSGKQDAS